MKHTQKTGFKVIKSTTDEETRDSKVASELRMQLTENH